MLLLLGCMLLGTLGVLAAPWGALSNYVDEDEPANTGGKYLLRKILNGETISVGLKRDDYTDKHYEKLSSMITEAYNNWFLNALRRIEKNRGEEFADVLPILRQGIDIQVSEQGNDINIEFMSLRDIQWTCGPSAMGCYVTEEYPPRIYLPKNINLIKVLSLGKENKKRITTHEIGHSLGFSDQYFQARSVNSDEMYSSVEERNSVMRHALSLTCDDADGMINLIDITRGVRRGGDLGWKTLCPNSQEYYIGGVSAGKGPYRIALSKDKGSVALTTYDKGQKVAKEVYPFAIAQGMVNWQETSARVILKRDNLDRPVLAEGPNGETIYYSYLYDRVDRLAVHNGRALNLVTTARYLPKQREGAMKDYKEMLIGQQGSVCLLKMRVFTKRGYMSEYVEGVDKPKFVRYIKHKYDQRGKLIENVYETPNEVETKQVTSLKPIVARSTQGGVRVAERIDEQISRQVKNSQEVQLGDRLDQWTRQTLQEFATPAKR